MKKNATNLIFVATEFTVDDKMMSKRHIELITGKIPTPIKCELHPPTITIRIFTEDEIFQYSNHKK